MDSDRQPLCFESWDSDEETNGEKLNSKSVFPVYSVQNFNKRTQQIELANSFGSPNSHKDLWNKIARILSTDNLEQIHERFRITNGYILGVTLETCQFLQDIYQNAHLLLYKCPFIENLADDVLAISWEIHKMSISFKNAGLRDLHIMDYQNYIVPTVRSVLPEFSQHQKDEFEIVDSLGSPENIKEFQKVLKKIFLTINLCDVQNMLRDTTAYIDGIVGALKEFIEDIEENMQELLIYKYMMKGIRVETLTHYCKLYELSRIFKDCIPENLEI